MLSPSVHLDNVMQRHLPWTPYDRMLDRLTINPTLQPFEKFISGMYLGEITRVLLLSFVDASLPTPLNATSETEPALLFGGRGSSVINRMWGVDSNIMSEIENVWREATAAPGDAI